MDIPELKEGKVKRKFITPRASLFDTVVTVAKPDVRGKGVSRVRDRTANEQSWRVRCCFQYRTSAEQEDEAFNVRYQAEALLRLQDGMDGIAEGWRVLVGEPRGDTEWKIIAVQWEFGFGRYPIVKLQRNSRALGGGV